MRIVVMSDSHMMVSALLDIIERHKDNADLFLFLGDGNKDLDTALQLHPDIKIDRVSGNCDFMSDLPASKVIEFGGKKILFTHGHPYNVKYGYQMLCSEARSIGADIVLFGHTHIPYVETIDSIHYMNPGSARDGNYGIVDIEPNGILMYNAKI